MLPKVTDITIQLDLLAKLLQLLENRLGNPDKEAITE
jgi:hypothetical protein